MPLLHRSQHAGQCDHFIVQFVQNIEKAIGLRYLFKGCLAPRHFLDRRCHQSQIFHVIRDALTGVGPFSTVSRIGQRGHFGRLQKIGDIARINHIAHKTGRGVGQLMRFIKYHRVGCRQQVGDPFFAQDQIGKKQGVINHHHIGILRLATRFQQKAFLDIGTVLAKAVFAGRGDAVPDIGVFGDLPAIGFVARARARGKDPDLA